MIHKLLVTIPAGIVCHEGYYQTTLQEEYYIILGILLREDTRVNCQL